MQAIAPITRLPSSYCLDAPNLDSDSVGDLASCAYELVCRTEFAVAGFCVINLGNEISSETLRRRMVSLKQELQRLHVARTGQALVFLSAARFDQQVTTKPHRDGGPDESLLLLGYEPTEVRSELAMLDYSRCAFDSGLTPAEFLERHNPMFSAGEQLLRPYTTVLNCFSQRSYQMVLINNSMAAYSAAKPAWQGVLHTATIQNPSDALRRVVNSTLLASVSRGVPEPVTEEQQAAFVTTKIVRRRGYDKQHLDDDT